MFIPPLRIALNGGGVRGLGHIGALEILEEQGYLSCVREYIGVSAGAFCAFCICIGYTFAEMKQLALQLDLTSLRNLNPETVFQFPDTYGLDSGENIERLFTILLQQKGYSPTMTFAELARLVKAPALRIFVTDLNTCQPYEYSAVRTPNAEVRMAVRASVSLPIYFTPVVDPATGHTMVDTVLVSDAPFSFLTEEERAHTLNIVFNVGNSSVESITTLYGFLYQVYCTACSGGFTPATAEVWKHQVALIDCRSVSSMHFEATVEEKAALIESGRSGMLRFLEDGVRKAPSRKGRRFSHPSL